MSALARFFNGRGVSVYGYDRTSTALTRTLEEEGMTIHYEVDLHLVRKQSDLVIYTPAIPNDQAELAFYRNGDYPLKKRSEVLGWITEHMFTVAVAGTHGKTTITSMIAHILKDSGFGCTAFIGGISKNYQSNFIQDSDRLVVVEADEYDRSFLQLYPDIAVVTAVDEDHLDIYGDRANLETGFSDFMSQVAPHGFLFLNDKIESKDRLANRPYFGYSISGSEGLFRINNLQIVKEKYRFDVLGPEYKLSDVEMLATGMHNVENFLAAIAVCAALGVEKEKIKEAVSSFEGIKRRFEYILRTEDCVVIDDYAHHPEELKALIAGARQLHPDRQMCIIFQPHLYSRTRDFATEFADSLSLADEVILLDIYPARELPIPGVSSQMIADLIAKETIVHCLVLDELLEFIRKKNKTELLLISGAGNVDKYVEEIGILMK